MIRTLILAVAMLVLAGAALSAPQTANEFLNLVNSDRDAGLITAEEALLIKFQHVFEGDRVPFRYQTEGFVPLKSATPLIVEFEESRSRLGSATREIIAGYLAEPEGPRLVYISPSGRFQLTYYTSGTDAVPSTDTNPANGIPDFVERAAIYLDHAWETECVEHSFAAPPIGSGYYSVRFENMNAYGYCSIVNSAAGTTRITLHHDYVGFPGNDDPEGSIAGAAKVTCAHEFKHATQFAGSRWSEGTLWVEVDAVWAEEFVYDQVNDYHNYLNGNSAIRQPTIPLDSETGSFGYDDCIWQMWMSQTWGVEFIEDYWHHRRTHTSQPVLASYEEILEQYGATFPEAWAMFTAWNYGTGYRAVAGTGYEEAADYPAGNFQAYTSSYPFTRTGSVEHLAANFIRLLGLNDDLEGTLDFTFNGANAGDMSVSFHIEKADGTGAIEVMPLDENNDGVYSLSIPMEDIDWMGVIVGNATMSGNALSYSLTVERTEALPEPMIELNAESVAVELEAGQTSQEIVNLANNGEAGSVMNYEVEIWGNTPVDPANKNVTGSTLTGNVTSYLPGTTFDVEFTVFNGSSDEEWIRDVDMDFPAGVTVNAATNFVGGSYGDMVHDGTLGNGADINWHGTVGAPMYGVLKDGESATATLSLTIDPGFTGDIVIPSVIGGDTTGGAPHTLGLDVVLSQADPEVTVTHPNGGEVLFVGAAETITWTNLGGVGNVNVEISMDGGDSWEMLAENIVNNGSLDTVIPGAGSLHAKVRVSETDGLASDLSDAEFTIILPVEWLAVSPVSGTIDNGDDQDLTLDFDAMGVGNGDHQAWIVVTESQEGTFAVLPVTMTVSGGGTSGVDTPAAFTLNGNYPNPFNPMTQISFNLPVAARTTVEVLDVRGRLVRTLHKGMLGEGPHELTWNGRDNAAQVVAAGLYLARLRTDGYEATVKMTLAK